MIKHWPNFVCESCTVRATLDRELNSTLDLHLLRLERMSLIDKAWYLAEGTHRSYQVKLDQIVRFEHTYGVPILRPSKLTRPATGPDVPLMWCQEAYSIKPSTLKRNADADLTLSFTTIRQFRAALGHYQLFDMATSNPTGAYFNRSRQVVLSAGRATDSISFTLHAAGLQARLGSHTRPSLPLLDRHVRWMDAHFNARCLAASTPREYRDLALAGLANLVLWLLWLRSKETFDTEWDDLEVLLPEPTEERDLLIKAGCVHWRLHESKSQRGLNVDTICAFRSLSGLSLGKWLLRARLVERTGPVFRHPNGQKWTSMYFRQHFLYPALYQLQALGDPALTPFDQTAGNRIEDKYWSLHCYRRGGRSYVSTECTIDTRVFPAATITQVYVHGRWSTSRRNEPIDKQYLHWTDWQRLQITLCCY